MLERCLCEQSDVYASKPLRDNAIRLGVAYPRLLREPLMLRATIGAIGLREKHRRCAKAGTIGDDSSRNDVARLRTFDHYGTLGCAHILYPPVMSVRRERAW